MHVQEWEFPINSEIGLLEYSAIMHHVDTACVLRVLTICFFFLFLKNIVQL